MSSQHAHGSTDNPEVIHEESDINVRAILWFVVVLTVITLSIDVAMYGLFRVLNHYEVKNEPAASPLAAPLAGPQGGPMPAPGLQTTPWADLKQFRASQLAYLNGYGWIDQGAGVARIPIAKAKELLLKQGLPVRPELAGTLEGTGVAATGESNGGRTIPAGQADQSSVPSAAPPATPPAATPSTTAPAPGTPGVVAPTKPGGGHD